MAVKPKPIYSPNDKCYRLHFSYRGTTYRRHYISQKRRAYLLQARINNLIKKIRRCEEQCPPDKSIEDFIFGETVETEDTSEPIQEPTNITLLQLLEQYRKIVVPPVKAESTCKTEQVHLRHLEKFLQQTNRGNPLLAEIDVGFFQYYKQFRYKTVSTDTVKKELATIQVLFQMAVEHSYISHNVVKDVKRDKSQVTFDRFRPHAKVMQMIKSGQYSDEEIRKIKKFQFLTPKETKDLISLAEGKWLHPILITLAHSGIRRGEVCNLEWADVDFELQYMYVRSRKSSQSRKSTERSFPIHPNLLPILQNQREFTKGKRWVFVGPDGSQLKGSTLREAYRKLVFKTEFQGTGYHTLRHSFISILASKGIEQHKIDAIVGHQTEEMRRRYRHLFPQDKQDAIKAVDVLDII